MSLLPRADTSCLMTAAVVVICFSSLSSSIPYDNNVLHPLSPVNESAIKLFISQSNYLISTIRWSVTMFLQLFLWICISKLLQYNLHFQIWEKKSTYNNVWWIENSSWNFWFNSLKKIPNRIQDGFLTCDANFVYTHFNFITRILNLWKQKWLIMKI